MNRRFPASFIRGGTSKGIVFHLRDLPADRASWDDLFFNMMGTPDRYGRQLNGMGGGVSSLSKVCVVGPPTVAGADIDYTFVQVQVKEARCDYKGNCGNMSSAMGPFAVDEGLVPRPAGHQAVVRIHNTNTGKIIESRFPVADGRSVEAGDLEIPGVHGTGAPVQLNFLEPGGASTGRLLPTGHVLDTLQVPGVGADAGAVKVSMVDAANACAFVDAAALGLQGHELPDVIEADAALMQRLADIRLHASVAMGIAPTLEAARAIRVIPFIAFVSAPQDTVTLSGETIAADAVDLVVRMLSNGQPHRALPLTGALCTAVAALLEGSIPQRLARPGRSGPLRLAMPSGVLTVDAQVRRGGVDAPNRRDGESGGWFAEYGSFFRTTRRLFDGFVYA